MKITKNQHITQWQLGDWQSLSQQTDDPWLQLAARIELGESQVLSEPAFTQASKVDQIQLLRSALHNGLGRSALLLQQPEEAQQYFQKALQLGPYPGDTRLLVPLRSAHQASQLGLPQTVYSLLPEENKESIQSAEEQTPLTSKLYQFLDQLLTQLAHQGKKMELDGMPVFNGKDPFMAGKTIMALGYWVTEYPQASSITQQRIKQAQKIIRLLENEKSTSWGAFFYLKGLRKLQSAGLLEACFSLNHLLRLEKELHWNTFVDRKTFQLKNKPTNFYQVAYAIAQLRFQLGWEGAEASFKILDALHKHYDEVCDECGFADETQGKGRYDRYSFLLVAEIAHRMREAGLTLPKNLKENLRKSADYVLINLNEEGDGFQYGRSIGAYGDTAFLEILTAAAWYGLLTEEELKAAGYFSQLCTQKFIDYWWDSKRGTVNLWEDGRVTDGYRGKHRVLGENFSLIYQHLYTQGIWQRLGYKEAEFSQKDYCNWLNTLPKATLTWFNKGEEKGNQQAVFTYRHGDTIFNLPLVNGEAYARQSVYLPIPYSSAGIQGEPGKEQPLLLPIIELETGEFLWPVSDFKEIELKQEDDGYTLSWKRSLKASIQILSYYRFRQNTLERQDQVTSKIANIKNITMQFPEELGDKLSLKGYQRVANRKSKDCYQASTQSPIKQTKLGWVLLLE